VRACVRVCVRACVRALACRTWHDHEFVLLRREAKQHQVLLGNVLVVRDDTEEDNQNFV